MSRSISQATITIQIDNYRHDGGYDLYLRFNGDMYLISKDFSKDVVLSMTFNFTKMSLSAFQNIMKQALVYSEKKDKWACTRVSITNSACDLEWSTETNREPRNQDQAGPNDNPITFTDFFAEGTDSNTWMQALLKKRGTMPLGKICLLGAHDAGMSILHGHTFFSHRCNTLTQSKEPLELLELGVRYFDIRPVWTGERYSCGHYSDTGNATAGIQGGNGVSIREFVDAINSFSIGKQELIVLNLSHDFDTTKRDENHGTYPPLTQTQYDDVFDELNMLKYLYKTDVSDLTTITLNSLIGSGHSAVIVIVDPSDSAVSIPKLLDGSGFYSSGRYNVINKYSNTNSLEKMSEDQIQKMKDYSNDYFLLSWTLTQDEHDASCFMRENGGSIIESARKANAILESCVESACTNTAYPKIIYLDAIEDDLPCTVVQYINYEVI